jgi:hypothetical protein
MKQHLQVSLLLQEGMQDDHAQFYLRNPCGQSSCPVGAIVCELSERTRSHVDLAFMKEDTNEFYCHPCELGSNLYAYASPPTK